MLLPCVEEEVRAVAADTPPMQSYGLAPGRSGYRLAELQCAPKGAIRRVDGAYSEYAVALVIAGAFEYASRAGAAISVPGSLVFGNANEEFSCTHLSGDGNRRLVLFLGQGMLEAIAADMGLDEVKFSRSGAPPCRASPAIAANMLNIARRSGDSDESAIAIASAALAPADPERAAVKASPSDERRILETVRYINANFAESCSLDDLAAIAGMGRFTFARRFRAITGETANQYVLSRRLSAAAALLSGTSAPVSDIAYDVGFRDLSYFYAQFRSVFGLAPGRWRRRAASERDARPLTS